MAGAKVLTKKTPEDFAKMEIAGRCVAAVHDAVRAAIAPGVTTAALEAIGAEVVRDHGCRPSFLGYHGFPATICTSPNRAIVHGIPGDYVLRDGDIISIDAGAIYEGWHGDAAFTAAVGDVADEVQKLIDVTEEALWNGLRQARVGKRLGDIGYAVEATAEPHGFGVVREYVGHGIGQQMHEEPQVPNYVIRPVESFEHILKPGLVLAIEPMLNLGTDDVRVLDDDWTVVTKDGKLSAHWEHTIAVTEDGYEILTLP